MQHFIVFQRLNKLCSRFSQRKGNLAEYQLIILIRHLSPWLPSLSYLCYLLHLGMRASLNIFPILYFPFIRKNPRKFLGRTRDTMPDGFYLSCLFAPLVYYKGERLRVLGHSWKRISRLYIHLSENLSSARCGAGKFTYPSSPLTFRKVRFKEMIYLPRIT